MNHRIIVENTQAQYFYNLIRNCARVFSTMTIRSFIKFANINALFLATYAEPILVFVRTTTYRFEWDFFATINSLFHCSLRKHAYSNIQKILPPKNENFQIKKPNILHISAKKIDCGYSLEPPRRGGSNE